MQGTFFQGIKKIAPHHILELTRGCFSCTSYLNLSNLFTSKGKSISDHVSQFKTYFDKTVYDRVINGPAAIMLSGGINSSTNFGSIIYDPSIDSAMAYLYSFPTQYLL
jgi:asparagine synthetase B (glutamine-hydrolysing)